MRNWGIATAFAGLTGVALFWILSAPDAGVTAAQVEGLTANAERGERIFHLSGCASCHTPPEEKNEAESDSHAPPLLSGGQRFVTQFGTFIAPNISPDGITGIGDWTPVEFANAVLNGVSPEGVHYYPAFPYTSYTRMHLQDVVDLKAYIDTLPPVVAENKSHEIPFPFSVRRGLGLWKLLYLSKDSIVNLPPEVDDLTIHGQYLVEGPGHCGECHTPRDAFGGPDYRRWLAGGPNPEGDGKIPNITPHESGLAEWESVDISAYLETGFTPDYDVVGSSMADVVNNMAMLPAEDRQAIAAYLKALPPKSVDKQ